MIQPPPAAPAVQFDHVSFTFDEQPILDDVSFTLPPGGMLFLLGVSGAGKSVLLRLVLGLLKPTAGAIFVNGSRVDELSERELLDLRADIGMLFQENALFDSLTVAENVGYHLDEETVMPKDEVRQRVEEVLRFVGLNDYVDRMPASLSGGQRRRVAIARAMASRPSLLLLDDPTTGLDPITATTIDDEIVRLRDLEHVTLMIVTHQLRDAFYIATHSASTQPDGPRIVDAGAATAAGAAVAARARFLVLHEGRIHFEGTGDALRASPDSFLRNFLYMTLPPW